LPFNNKKNTEEDNRNAWLDSLNLSKRSGLHMSFCDPSTNTFIDTEEKEKEKKMRI
jgi:predicted AAA+ superfamily ATPase